MKARDHITGNASIYPVLNDSGHLDTDRWNDNDLFERGIGVILATEPVRPSATRS
jgi:hypothetical protein